MILNMMIMVCFLVSVMAQTGQFQDGKIDDKTKDLFYQAVGNEANYGGQKNDALHRICATKLLSVKQQVVSGMNYNYTVSGCAVSQANLASAGCMCTASAQTYEVLIFSGLDDKSKVEKVIAKDINQGGSGQGSTTGPNAVGGWQTGDLKESKPDFVKAFTNSSNLNGVTTFICPTQYLSVQQQVVAGTKYKFYVKGCAVKSTNDVLTTESDCVTKCGSYPIQSYVVSVFSQPWTNTYSVSNIALCNDSTACGNSSNTTVTPKPSPTSNGIKLPATLALLGSLIVSAFVF